MTLCMERKLSNLREGDVVKRVFKVVITKERLTMSDSRRFDNRHPFGRRGSEGGKSKI